MLRAPMGPLTGKRVAYAGYSPSLSGPGDRRRFVHYARKREVAFDREAAGADVVVVNALSDLSYWSRVGRGAPRLVFELIDSYLEADPLEPRAVLRGLSKFALRQHRRPELIYSRALERMLLRADAVVCATPEQRARMLAFNSNVHPILDFHFEQTAVKESYATGTELKLVWEGLPGNLVTFGVLAPVLRELARERAFKLVLITDPTYRMVNGPFPPRPTRKLIDRYLWGLPVELVPWSSEALVKVAPSSDLAVIPIHDSPMARAKPENKLLMLWRMGLPVLTSDTPAYARSMKGAGLAMALSSADEWAEALRSLAEDEPARRLAGLKGLAYAKEVADEDRLLAQWDALFASLFRGGR
jgi:glycosyltransferase involved in cell wall biosynthesis